MLEKVDLYIFSGTGNTLRVAQAMAERLRQAGVEVTLRRMEAGPPHVAPQGALGLAFPVAACITYPLVWDFVEALPEGGGAPAFMVDTMGGFSGALVGPMRRAVERRGYRPIGAREIVMPANLYPLRPNPEKNRLKVERGLAEARRYADELVAGITRWGRVPGLADALCWFMRLPVHWRATAWTGRRLRVDQARCTRCGLCARLCPVGNITLRPYPRYTDRCQQCMRCISFCPVEAISLPWFRHGRYRAVDAAEL
jgi:ferredoxin